MDTEGPEREERSDGSGEAENTDLMPTDRLEGSIPQQALIEEYKVCDQTVTRLDHLIWQMAAILFPITLAGLAYFGVNTNHTVSDLTTLIVVALGSTILLLNWYGMCTHWAAYQKVAIYRMREIEKDVGFWLYRYSGFVRLTIKDRERRIESAGSEEDKTRLRRANNYFDRFPFFGLFRSMRIVTLVLILGWFALVVREIIIVF